MARYVCDFAAVRDVGQKVQKEGEELRNSINTYSTTIDNNLSGWTGGTAKSSFMSSNQKIVEASTAHAEYMIALGQFIQAAADKIESVENQLSGLSI